MKFAVESERSRIWQTSIRQSGRHSSKSASNEPRNKLYERGMGSRISSTIEYYGESTGFVLTIIRDMIDAV